MPRNSNDFVEFKFSNAIGCAFMLGSPDGDASFSLFFFFFWFGGDTFVGRTTNFASELVFEPITHSFWLSVARSAVAKMEK